MNKMRILPIVLLLLLDTVSTNGQNTIGIPQIINFNKNDFKAGTQTWDIDQDSKGRMYFANNEGLLTYDGTFWELHPLPNKTIISQNNCNLLCWFRNQGSFNCKWYDDHCTGRIIIQT